MPQLPLVSAELQRVTSGFADAARELMAAQQLVADLGTGSLGTPVGEIAIETGLRDLGVVLARLEATASACVVALRRYDDSEAP